MKLAVSTSIFERRLYREEDFKALKAGGIEHLEVSCPPHRFNYDDPTYIESVAAWVNELGLEVPIVHAPLSSPLLPHPLDLSHLDEDLRRWSLEEVKKGARVLARLGGDILVVHAGAALAEGEDPGPRLRQAKRSLEELVSCCAPQGIRLAVENLLPGRVTGSSEELMQLVEAFEPEWVGVCLDTGHAHIGEGAVTALEVVKERLLTFHIDDNYGIVDDHIMPMRGTINWSSFMRALGRTGYDGWFTYELVDAGDVTQSLDEIQDNFPVLCQLMEKGMGSECR